MYQIPGSTIRVHVGEENLVWLRQANPIRGLLLPLQTVVDIAQGRSFKTVGDKDMSFSYYPGCVLVSQTQDEVTIRDDKYAEDLVTMDRPIWDHLLQHLGIAR